jgi:hypothetical protein
MNIVILRGTLSSEPALRTLPSGSTLLSCEVTTRSPDGPARSVPVAWFDPPAASLLAVGTEVVVTGEVRRRFFRAGGATAVANGGGGHHGAPRAPGQAGGPGHRCALADAETST